MDDEFKLCWKNFQDNIATGFQSLYDRGDLVDVTLALCDGKLLQAHKIVLAICSPYFQEIFITNPCKHPIIILKDVSYTIMCELLEFMYQGVVNVKHTELQAFMKIGQLLQIKGLATNSSSSAASSISDKSSTNHNDNAETASVSESANNAKAAVTPPKEASNSIESNSNHNEKPTPQANSDSNTQQRTQSPIISPAASPSLNITSVSHKSNESQHSLQMGASASAGHKRHLSDFNSDTLSIYSRNKMRRSLPTAVEHSSENNDGSDTGGGGGSSSMDQMNTEDLFFPQMSMVEARYDVKRDSADHHLHSTNPSAAAAAAAASLRNSFNPAAFGLDYTFYNKNNSGSAPSSQEYPNELNISGDFSKGFANHMDIPPNCPNVVMLSPTSLLHGSCVFNRNNTVATQQGMKTYWLCKAYRISMCRARCITHQGKIISATGVHNHAPHMRGNNGGAVNDNMAEAGTSASSGNNISAPPQSQTGSGGGLRFPPSIGASSSNMFQPSFHGPPHGHTMSPTTPSSMQNAITVSEAATMNPITSHHFAQTMSNIVQHHPSSHLLPPNSLPSLQPPTQPPLNNSIQTIMHGSSVHSPQTQAGYEMSSPAGATMAVRSGSQYDSNDKPLNDDHIPVHNAAELSPANVRGNDENDHHSNASEPPQQQHHHQRHPVQVIDSITISPGNHHNFKMEPL